MRFAATLTLALFTASASAFDAEAKMRVLARVEANAARSLQGKGNGNDKKTTGTGGGGGPKKETGGGKGKGKGSSKWEDSEHSAHLDANDSGITLDKVEVLFGEALNVEFEVLAEHVETDVLATLDAEQMSNWKIAIYERMQHVDPSQEPILTVTPTYTRRLQETEGGEYDPLAGVGEGVTETDEQPEDPDLFDEGGPAVPVTLPISGTATFAAIDSDTFAGKSSGLDVVLIDENGVKIIGPGTFYAKKTEEMEAEEEKAKGKKPDHPLARHDHGKKKKASGKKEKGPSKPKEGLGKGSGSNGNMIIETKGALANYILSTDLMEPEKYEFGATVTVTYDVTSAASGGRRRLQGNKGGNKNKDEEGEPTETDPSPDTTTGATEPVTTTTGIDMGADDGDLGLTTEPEPDFIDPMDTSLWKMGVFMRMEFPDGQEPLYSVDLGGVLAGTMTIATDAASPIMQKDGNLGGYDVWILDGTGRGQAGPVTFLVAAEEP